MASNRKNSVEQVLTPLELDILNQAEKSPESEGEKARKLGPMRSAMELFGTASAQKLIPNCSLPLTIDELIAVRFIGQTIKKPTSENVKTYAMLRGDLKEQPDVQVTVSKVDENLMGSALPDGDDGSKEGE